MATIPATLSSLKQFLIEQCYQPHLFHVGPGWAACSDTCCIEQVGSRFEIFHVERGVRTSAISIHADESTACSEFIQKLDQEKWSKAHCVASVKEESLAKKLHHASKQKGFRLNGMTYPLSTDPTIQDSELLALEEIKSY